MTFLWFSRPWFEFHGNESKSSLSFYIILTLKLYLCSWINVLAPLEVKLLLRSHWDCSPSWKIYKVSWIRFEITLEVPLLCFSQNHILQCLLIFYGSVLGFHCTDQKHCRIFILQHKSIDGHFCFKVWPKITLFTFCFSWPTYKITGFLLCVLWGH